MKRYAWTLSLLLALFLIPMTAQAQTSVSIGAKGGIDLGDIEEPYVGADARIDFGGAPVRINPFFNYYFAPENFTYWSAGVNGLFDFPVEDSPIAPFVGGGVQILNTSIELGGDFGGSASNTDLGLSGVGGVEFNLDSGIRPFVQGELGIIFSEGDSGTLLGISGGVLFEL